MNDYSCVVLRGQTDIATKLLLGIFSFEKGEESISHSIPMALTVEGLLVHFVLHNVSV